MLHLHRFDAPHISLGASMLSRLLDETPRGFERD
jgi:hypothetical protein